jgi:hypothetical protein
MVELTRGAVRGAEDVRRLTLPADSIPRADAIVAVGMVLNYLPSLGAMEESLRAMASALRPHGLVVFDVAGKEYGRSRRDAPAQCKIGEDWAVMTRFSMPREDAFVREITVFRQDNLGTWRRDDEVHQNILVDIEGLGALLVDCGLTTEVRPSFGSESLPVGLQVLVGRRL